MNSTIRTLYRCFINNKRLVQVNYKDDITIAVYENPTECEHPYHLEGIVKFELEDDGFHHIRWMCCV